MQNTCPTRIKLRWRWWMVLVLILAFLLLLGFRSPTPKVAILPFDELSPSPVRALVERGWSWIRFHLPGPHPSVLISAKVLQFESPLPPAALPSWQPDASTNGIRLWWVIGDQKLVMQQLPGATVMSQPRIQTLSGMRGSMAVGGSVIVNGKPEFVGLELTTLPKLKSDHVDLTAAIKFTEASKNQAGVLTIKTNLAVRTRTQIPRGGRVVLLVEDTNKPMAVILSATKR